MALAKPLAVVGLALLVGAGLTACDNSTPSGCTKPTQTTKPALYTPARGGGGGHGSGGHSSGHSSGESGTGSSGTTGSGVRPRTPFFGGGSHC